MIESLYEENFAQGRLERTLNLPVTPVMDEETVRKKVCYKSVSNSLPLGFQRRDSETFSYKSHIASFWTSCSSFSFNKNSIFTATSKCCEKGIWRWYSRFQWVMNADESCDSSNHVSHESHITWLELEFQRNQKV